MCVCVCVCYALETLHINGNSPISVSNMFIRKLGFDLSRPMR